MEKKNPNIIVLRSTKPSFNNKTINYLQFFVSNGWNIIKTKPLKQKVNRKYANTISFMLSSPFLHSLNPCETHPENDVGPMMEKEANRAAWRLMPPWRVKPNIEKFKM
ncbi:hypothetical protein MSIBF_A910003 [groundwater metagenome]|uniref:Uncharacterized protein n=1 Tax=groundwater metagenome TaxID=717931 RepID=A0A098EDD3_9ZZZZ